MLFGFISVVNFSGEQELEPYLSPQRDALGQLLDRQWPAEVALLRGAAEPADHRRGHHDDDDEEAQAVDEDLQVCLRGQQGGRHLCDQRERKVEGAIGGAPGGGAPGATGEGAPGRGKAIWLISTTRQFKVLHIKPLKT